MTIRFLVSELREEEYYGDASHNGGTMSKAVLQTLRGNMRRALSRGELEDAAQILARLKKEDPLSLETRGLELELYLNSHRHSEASALAGQLCHLFPQSSRIFFLAGKLAYRMKNYAEAESCFRECQRLYPNWRTQHWLGKTLTQKGEFEQAESLLVSVKEQNPYALLDLCWLHERRGDLEAALQACDAFLAIHPGHEFAQEQRVRIKARMLEPEVFIEEVGALSELGAPVSDALLPEYVEKLFETGQGPRARAEVDARMETVDAKLGARLAWVCHRAQAFDLSCSLFLAHLEANHANYKYLSALESAARKCNRLEQVLEAYRALSPRAPHLYGRCKLLQRGVKGLG